VLIPYGLKRLDQLTEREALTLGFPARSSKAKNCASFTGQA